MNTARGQFRILEIDAAQQGTEKPCLRGIGAAGPKAGGHAAAQETHAAQHRVLEHRAAEVAGVEPAARRQPSARENGIGKARLLEAAVDDLRFVEVAGGQEAAGLGLYFLEYAAGKAFVIAHTLNMDSCSKRLFGACVLA